MRCGSKRTKSLSLSSLSVLSLCSLSRSPQTRTQRQYALLFEPRSSSPPLSFFALCTRNEYVLINGEILFSSNPFPHTSCMLYLKRNECEGECTLRSATHEKAYVVLFAVQKPPFFVLRRVRLEYPLQTYTLNDCLFTFSLSRGDIFTPLQSAQDTRTILILYHHGGRRRNRNVRVPSGNQPTVEFDHQRA